MSAAPPDDKTPDLKRRENLVRLGSLWAATAALPFVACGGSGDGPTPSPVPPPGSAPPPGGGSGGGSPPPAPVPPSPPPPASIKTTVLNSTLEAPWGIAFLPDGRMLVTQKAGSMVILSADGKTKSGGLAGVPTVASTGQGGLLDVVLDPDFTTMNSASNWVYFSYSESSGGLAGTAVGKARLDVGSGQLLEFTRIFQQLPKVNGGNHFGSRIVFRGDKTLFITLGERDQGSPAQDLTGHLGKVVRIKRDGNAPDGTLERNPDFGAGTPPTLWSYGHRNPQGAALHPTTGELWEAEHGPRGGDEINIVRKGKNYGWPVISYGQQYNTTDQFGEGTSKEGMEQPVTYWEMIDGSAWVSGGKSSIAPSGITFYTGDKLAGWKGNLFVGALAGQALWRLVLDGNVVTSRERLFTSLNKRIRCVRQGPDGWLYLLTDDGKLIRVEQ